MTTAELLQTAESVAREAGALLLEHGKRLRQVNFQNANDVKLQADIESERLIRERLKETGLSIIGEEEGGDPKLVEKNELYWVVDPLDGTYNYLRNQGLCAVSIGLCKGLDFVAGVIYDFNTNDLWSGSDAGAFHNGEQMGEPMWADTIEEACIMTGFAASRDFSDEGLKRFLYQVQSFKKVRMIGSAAMAIIYVAQGKGDIYTEESVRLWDMAGAIPILRAVGGQITLKPARSGADFAYDIWLAGSHPVPTPPEGIL